MIQMIPMVEKVLVAMIPTTLMLLDMIQMIPMVARVQVAVIPMIPIQIQEKAPMALIQIVHLEKAPNMTLKIPTLTYWALLMIQMDVKDLDLIPAIAKALILILMILTQH